MLSEMLIDCVTMTRRLRLAEAVEGRLSQESNHKRISQSNLDRVPQ